MARMPDEHVALWNERLREDAAEGDDTARVQVDAAWEEAWLSRCADRHCIVKHHFGFSACAVRRYESEWPVACVSLSQDQYEVIADLTKPQLALLIADLQALLEVLP